MNGKRLILVGKPGGRAGRYRYHRWLGSEMEPRPTVYCGHTSLIMTRGMDFPALKKDFNLTSRAEARDLPEITR